MTLHTLGRVLPIVLALVSVSAGAALAARPQPQPMAMPENSPVTIKAYNDGRLAESYMWHEDRTDQKIALWVPDGCKTIRGVYLHLHRASEAYRTDFQEFARAMDFAVAAPLMRWAGYERILPAQIERLGKALGHPEVAGVPWAAMGGSRNVGALTAYTQLDPNPNRILALLFNGGPGIGIDLADPDQVALFSRIPIIVVNGSADPFVNGNEWMKKLYPKIRAKDLPWAGGVEWGGGHAPHTADTLFFPFVEAAMAVRYPKDAASAKGTVELAPFPYEKGWLLGPVDWENPGDEPAARVGEYQGDPKQAVWLPDERTIAIWRAYVTREPAARVTMTAAEGGTVALALTEVPEARFAQVTYYDGERLLGEGGAAPLYVLETPAVSGKGLHYVYAVCAGPDGAERRTRPITIAGGRHVDQEAGMMAAFVADLPQNLIDLKPGEKRTLDALLARKAADVPSEWQLAYEDDFSAPLGDEWYEYYTASGKQQSNVMQVVDGAMELKGDPHQAVAMLRWDWPDDVAVEYRAKAMGERHCDLSVVLSGNPSGSAFPWREGMMFQFGGHFNEGSYFLIREQPDKNWQAADCGARIVPGKWQTVRVERLGGLCKAFIDGKLVCEQQLDPEVFDQFYGRRIGLYTFGSTARFDDVKVFVRHPVDPAAVQPPMPSNEELAQLVRGLVRQMGVKWGEQNAAARRLLRDFSFTLAPAIRQVIDEGGIQDEKLRERLESGLEAIRPE